MIESLFSLGYREILLTALDKYDLSHKGYNTYNYLEDNIRPLVKDKDKDTYRLVKVGNVRTNSEIVNIWFIGYYDYSSLPEQKSDNVYVGKSVCLTYDEGDGNYLSDKSNLLFDSYSLKDFDADSKDKVEFISNYWFNILLSIISETDISNIDNKYSDTVIHGVKIYGLIDYIKLAVIYHLYKASSLYNKNYVKGITVEDIMNNNKLFKNKEDLIKFISSVDKYRK